MKRFAGVLLFCIAGLGCVAEKKTNVPSVFFGPIPLHVVRTYIASDAGTPAGKAKLNDPAPNDFPPSIQLFVEDTRSHPSFKHGPVYMLTARNWLRIYRITDVSRAPYETIQPHIKLLQTLLKERPASVPSGEFHDGKYGDLVRLPDYPPRNAGHLLQIKLRYLDAPWGSGLFYITQFVQGPGNRPNNEELVGIFQGLSKDRSFYVSADFRITHPRLPFSGKDADIATAKATAFLAKQSDTAFTPELGKVCEWLAHLEMR